MRRIDIRDLQKSFHAAGFDRPLKVGLLVAVLAAIYALSLPNYYRSEGRILPGDGSAGEGHAEFAQAASMIGMNLPGADDKGANNVEILKSYWLKEKLLEATYEFRDRAWRFGAENAHNETLSDYLHCKNLDRGMAALDKIYLASRDPKTKVLEITAETTSPQLSQQIVQRSIELLEYFVREKSRTRGGNKAIFSKERLGEAEKEYDAAEEEFGRFLERNQDYQTSSDPKVRLRGVRLEGKLQLRRQLSMTLAINHEQALLEEKNDLSVINVLDRGNLPFEKSRPSRAKIVILAFLVSFFAVFGWDNRSRFIDRHGPQEL